MWCWCVRCLSFTRGTHGQGLKRSDLLSKSDPFAVVSLGHPGGKHGKIKYKWVSPNEHTKTNHHGELLIGILRACYESECVHMYVVFCKCVWTGALCVVHINFFPHTHYCNVLILLEHNGAHHQCPCWFIRTNDTPVVTITWYYFREMPALLLWSQKNKMRDGENRYE